MAGSLNPARTSAQPAKAPESPAPKAGYGRKWRALSVRYDRDSHSWRTAHCLFDEVLQQSSVTLPKWGMMLGGAFWELTTWARPISVKESGYWPTPVAHDDGKSPEAHMAMKARMKGGPRHKPTSLTVMVKGIERGMWPTPTVQDANGRDRHNQRNGSTSPSLLGAVRMWPTPCSTDGTHGGRVTPRKSREGGNLIEAVSNRTFPTPTSSMMTTGDMEQARTAGSATNAQRPTYAEANEGGGTLNPQWVAWLLGIPMDWTSLDLKHSGMPKCRQWRRSLGKFFPR